MVNAIYKIIIVVQSDIQQKRIHRILGDPVFLDWEHFHQVMTLTYLLFSEYQYILIRLLFFISKSKIYDQICCWKSVLIIFTTNYHASRIKELLVYEKKISFKIDFDISNCNYKNCRVVRLWNLCNRHTDFFDIFVFYTLFDYSMKNNNSCMVFV